MSAHESIAPEIRLQRHHTHVFGDRIELKQLLADQNIGSPIFLHLYCDELLVSGCRSLKLPQLRWVRIFAREIKGEEQQDIEIGTTQDVTLIADIIPAGFAISGLPIMIDKPAAIGVQVCSRENRIHTKPIRDVAPMEIRRRTLDDFKASGTKKPRPELPRLLERLLEIAFLDLSALPESAEATRMCSACRYGIALTRNSSSQIGANMLLNTLLQRIDLPDGALYQVPRARAESGRQYELLKSWESGIQRLADIHSTQDFNTLLGQRLAEANQDLLEKLQSFREEDGKFETDNLRDRLSVVIASRKAAEHLSKEMSTEVDDRRRYFDIQRRKWVQQRQLEAKIAMAIAVLEVVAVVGLTILALGPAAPAAAPVVAGVGKGAADIAEAVQKAEDVYEKLGAVLKKTPEVQSKWEKVKSIADKAGTVKEWGDKVVDFQKKFGVVPDDPSSVLQGLRKGVESSSGVDPDEYSAVLEAFRKGVEFRGEQMQAVQNTDFVELKCRWDEYAIDHEKYFDDIAALKPPIDGVAEYRVAMKKLVSRARAQIEVRREEQSIQQEYIKALRYKKLLEDRISNLKANKGDGAPSDADSAEQARKYLFQADLALISGTFALTAQKWVLSKMYEECLKDSPVKLRLGPSVDQTSANKQSSIISYMTQLDEFQRKELRIQDEELRFSTNDVDCIFAHNWQQTLREQGTVHFEVPVDLRPSDGPEYAEDSAYITAARVFFEGVVPAGTRVLAARERTVPMRIDFGPIMRQRCNGGSYCLQSIAEAGSDFNYNFGNPAKTTAVSLLPAVGKRPATWTPTLYSEGVVKLRPKDAGFWDVSRVSEVKLYLTYGYYDD